MTRRCVAARGGLATLLDKHHVAIADGDYVARNGPLGFVLPAAATVAVYVATA
eukprot:COSAG06_NODE_36926_length_441_cov_1.046784_2_plen_52_part_01